MAALMALPLGARLAAQTRPGPNTASFSAMATASCWPPTARCTCGCAHRAPTPRPARSVSATTARGAFTLAAVPNLTGVVNASGRLELHLAVLGDGRLLGLARSSGWLGTTTQAQMETLASLVAQRVEPPLPQSVRYEAVDVSSVARSLRWP